jgi:hypothetical protein
MYKYLKCENNISGSVIFTILKPISMARFLRSAEEVVAITAVAAVATEVATSQVKKLLRV